MNISHVNVAPVNQLCAFVSNMRADQPLIISFKGIDYKTTAFEVYMNEVSQVLVVTDSYSVGSYIRIEVR